MAPETIKETTAFSDPVGMTMTMHQHCAASQGLQPPANQLPFTKAVPMRSDSTFADFRIFDNMVVKSEDPARLRVLCGSNLDPSYLFD